MTVAQMPPWLVWHINPRGHACFCWPQDLVISWGNKSTNPFSSLNIFFIYLLFLSSSGNKVEVGRAGELPFMSYQFNKQLNVNYIGIHTGWDYIGKWIYCDNKSFTSTKAYDKPVHPCWILMLVKGLDLRPRSFADLSKSQCTCSVVI